jgi:hypothetical protein
MGLQWLALGLQWACDGLAMGLRTQVQVRLGGVESASRVQVLGLGDNRIDDAAMGVLAPEMLRLEALSRIRLDNNMLERWSSDWGVGHVGTAVLRRWLVDR